MNELKSKLSELKSIHEWIRSTSNAEIFFVSLLVYPLFMGLYYWLIKILELYEYKNWILVVMTALYCISIIIMKSNQTLNERMEVDLLVIKNHSKTFRKEYIGFDKLLEMDKNYTEKYLKKLIRKYPDELIIAEFSSENSMKKGLKLLKYLTLVPEPTI
jgi:hypothetical protein